MFIRHRPAAVAALLLASLPVAGLAADTKPLAPEPCANGVQVSNRVAAYPPKAIGRQKSAAPKAVQCQREESKPLILVGFTDARGGVALDRGQLSRVIETIYARRSTRRPSAELTNLCASHTALRQFDQARDTCDAAVAAALGERSGRGAGYKPRASFDQSLGVAYSNRAVLNWLSGDAVAAHNDLSKARAVVPTAKYVSRNAQATEQAPALARVEVRGRIV